MNQGHEYDLPGAFIRDLVELVARWKVAPAELLAELPVSVGALADPATRVPVRVCESVFSRALGLTQEPALAFHFGTQMRLSSITAATLREACDLAMRAASTPASAIRLSLCIEGDTASLAIAERAPLGTVREVIVLALLIGLGQSGVGECAFPEPDYMKSLNDGRLRFDRPAHRLVFPAGDLAQPLGTAIEQCERELDAAVDAGLPGRARAIMARDERLPALERLARELHVSPRTLKRKLAARGTTFSDIRDDLLRERALLLLDTTALSVGQIAERLGYTELPNFTRAFRRWTGTTPMAYRSRDDKSASQ